MLRVFTIVYIIREDGKLLMMRRKSNRDINGGRLSAPGGKVEPGEDVLSAAKREAHEETGLVAHDAEYRGCYAYLSNTSLKNPAGIIHFVVIRQFSGELTQTCEEGSLEWLSRSEIFLDPTFEQDHRDTLSQILDTPDIVGAIGIWKDGKPEKWFHSKEFYESRR